MVQRNPKTKKFNSLLFDLCIFVGALLALWTYDLYKYGWSIEPLFKIIIVTLFLFLIASYLLEAKTAFNPKLKLLLYFLYFMIVGTFASAVISQNQLNGQMIFIYFSLSLFSSLIWQFICQKLKTKK
ncbi:hypothetical protein IGI52_001926 [Enterococcus sp. DIV0187]